MRDGQFVRRACNICHLYDTEGSDSDSSTTPPEMEVTDPGQYPTEPTGDPVAESSEPAAGLHFQQMIIDSGSEPSIPISLDDGAASLSPFDDYSEILVDDREGVWGVRPHGSLARVPGPWNTDINSSRCNLSNLV